MTYGLRATEEGIVLDGELSVRNLTVNIGCSCSYFVPIMFQAHLQAMFDEGEHTENCYYTSPLEHKTQRMPLIWISHCQKDLCQPCI